MYVAVVPNRGSPPAILLRESYREGRSVRTRTLANLSHWPPAQIETLRRVLRGETLVAPEDAFEIVRSRPHGHVAAIVGTLRRLGLEQVIASRPSRQRSLVVGMIAARLLAPASKLATARGFDPRTQHSTLGEVLGLEAASAEDLYEAMDWVVARQGRIEAALARRHLQEGALVPYDVTSVVYEGKTYPLVSWGHPRDGRRGKPQLLVGVVTNVEGIPVAVEVFEGHTGDPTTLAPQISRVRQRFGLQRVVLVGDRGMLTSARLREELAPAQLDWITALRAPRIRQLVEGGALQLSLFDQRDLAEIISPDYPGERLIVCRNPLLAEERARKREALLAATEQALEGIAQATRRVQRPLRGREQIALRVGRVINRFKVGKHVRWEITDETFTYERDQARIAQEAALDGIYVIRTSVPAEALGAVARVFAEAERLAQTQATGGHEAIHAIHGRRGGLAGIGEVCADLVGAGQARLVRGGRGRRHVEGGVAQDHPLPRGVLERGAQRLGRPPDGGRADVGQQVGVGGTDGGGAEAPERQVAERGEQVGDHEARRLQCLRPP